MKNAQGVLYDMGFDTPGIYDENLLRDIESYASEPCDEPVLITGPTGTGKEIIAKAIHEMSLRKGKPFIHVLCPGLSPALLESELFGHIKGSFTGAMQDKPGIFEVASDGTVFLDEVADLPIELQPRILGVLNEGKFRPVGSAKEKETKARIIAATNQDLLSLGNNKFRQDLYYRISVLPIRRKALADEIRGSHPSGMNIFVLRIMAEIIPKTVKVKGKKELSPAPVLVTPEAIKKLALHTWPGNFRELRNVLKRAYWRNRGNNPTGIDNKPFLVHGELPKTIIDESMIIFDAPSAHPVAKNDLDLSNILLKDILKHADDVRAEIIEAKIREVLSSGKDIKPTLMQEGCTEADYQNFRKKVERITKKKIKDFS